MQSNTRQLSPVTGPPRAVLWLFAIVVGGIILRLVTFNGIVGADDVSISSLALRVLEEGPYLPEGHYAARIGLIYPVAFIFAVAGVGEWQMVALPFVASVLSIYLAYVIGAKLLGVRGGLIAAALVAFFPLDVGNASMLFPDLPLGVVLAGSFALALQVPESKRPYFWALLAGLAWGYAWLIKVEAFFMGFVYLALLWQHRSDWRPILLIFAGAAFVVFAENLVYWVVGGEVFHRLHAVQEQGGGRFVEEYSETSLWVFPKAWFITFYQFGLHYWFLALGLVWLIVRPRPGMLAIWVWVIVFLLWLQFGGNPFAENYRVKSHLLRYCGMVTVPMAIIISAMLDDWWSRGSAWLARGALIVLVTLGLFFANFNTLSYERQLATKRALDIAVAEDAFPLFLDRTSNDVAEFYLFNDARTDELRALQRHDFRTQRTELTPFEEIDGFILLNRGFMDYAWKRYRMERVDLAGVAGRFEVMATIDNPGNWLAYQQARVLKGLAELIPVAALRDKIGGTGESLLEGRDAVLLRRIQ